MASLVADYGSDSAEEDEDPGPEERIQGGAEPVQKVSCSRGSPDRNYFMTVDSEEEEDENSADAYYDDCQSPSGDQHQQDAVKLPKPNFDSGGDMSVFANPYRAAEEARNSLLERHVKMTPTGNNQQRSIHGKKVCWNYRKGRCRFGSTCKFAHDSDIATSKQTVVAAETPAGTETVNAANNFANPEQ